MGLPPRPAARLARACFPRSPRGGWAWLVLATATSLAACNTRAKQEEKPLPAAPSAVAQPTVAAKPALPAELAPAPSASASTPEPEEPLVVGPPQPPAWDGPFLVVTRTSAGVYSEPTFDRKKKIGYVRNGAKIPVKSEIVSKDECSGGWRAVVGGGFICKNAGSLDPNDKELKFVQKQPVLDEVLPYTYARNAKNGTPLYKSVPTPEQMYGYEPYLEAAKKWREKQEKEAAARAAERKEAAARTADKDAADGIAKRKVKAAADAAGDRDEPTADGDVKPASSVKENAAKDPTERGATGEDAPTGDPAASESETNDDAPEEGPSTPWWQQDGEDANLHEVTLEDLQKEADDVLAMRMMKGFYVAIDKTFRWNERLWYKTTKGLVAPADRFWQVAGSKFQGIELEAKKYELPVGFVYGSAKSATLYELDSDDKLKPDGTVERMSAVNLTGKQRKIGKNNYHETADGLWIKEYQVRVATAVQPPEGIGPRERWIDINVSTQTLVAYAGQKPVYATMVSSGKESKVKDQDHRTPRGEWRIREKHVATTMDGNGSAAGDLPYSIEDVPFVAYFHRSYAVHAAFWHRNYGVRMSHGCVNLSPLDAKWVFFFTDPQLPAGWHGVWSTEKNPGSRVVIHE